MTYRPHGHNPNDDEVKRLGYRAFGPARAPFTPTADDFKRAAGDMATGDRDELVDVAQQLAKLWPNDDEFDMAAYYHLWYGGFDDDWDGII